MELEAAEKERIRELIDRFLETGEPLPARLKSILFAQPHGLELIWPGKSTDVTNTVLPFQIIEQIDEPRTETHQIADLFARDPITGRQSSGWTNKLIWGDNKLVLSSLKNGPMRQEIDRAGGLKLVYIDPPFDVGADFSFNIEVGDGETYTKEASFIEEIAYRDTWGRGRDSYIAMLYERLRLVADLMAPDSSIYIHCDHRVDSLIRLACDEIFGPNKFQASICWKSSPGHSDAKLYSEMQDEILFYVKGDNPTWNQLYQPYDNEYLNQHYQKQDPDGRKFEDDNLTAYGLKGGGYTYEWNGVTKLWRCPIETMRKLHDSGQIYYTKTGVARYKRYLDEMPGAPISDLWTDIPRINSQALEKHQYPTQKPEKLLDRIISASSNPGDIVMDFFCGSGTSLAVAEKLGRKWIGCDLGRFAIHTSRKRLIGVQRQLKQNAQPYRSFEILNLGKYERQYFVGIDPTLPEAQRAALSAQKEEHYLTLILQAYRAERSFQSPPFQGRKGHAMVLVGPIDAPVTELEVTQAVKAAERLGLSRVDILGFEFEMGLAPRAQDEAKAKGVTLALRYIPKDVFDKRAVEKGQVQFYDVAYAEVAAQIKGRAVTVTLKDFGVFYRQEDVDALLADMKNGAAKVLVHMGQIMRIGKGKDGAPVQEVLTRHWTDWIDYWAVDFNYENKPEIIRLTQADGAEAEHWTGGYVFENEWQAFRTRKDRTLELASAAHEYDAPGTYKIAVKIIDIFGNDTTKILSVKVGK